MAPSITNAQGFDPSAIKEIPSYKEHHSYDEFVADAKMFTEVPFGDKYLAYEVMLPRGWLKSEDKLDNKGTVDDGAAPPETRLNRRLLGEVARYYKPGGLKASPRLEISALELEHEITARNWFLHHVFKNGYTLQGMRVVSERRVEGMYVYLSRGSLAYKVRMVAEINGPRVILAAHYQPERDIRSELRLMIFHEGGASVPKQRRIEIQNKLMQGYYKELAQQEYAMESFEFLNPEMAQVELSRNYRFLDLLQFEYPSSWRLVNPEIYDITEMSAYLMSTQDEETLIGEIKIAVISTELDTDIPTEISYIKEDVAKRGLELNYLIGVVEDYTVYDHVFFHRAEAYNLQSIKEKILDHEFWVCVMVEDRYYYFVTMITPGRDVDFYNWARNTEAFEKVIETIRPI
jgi:hypothetical protein